MKVKRAKSTRQPEEVIALVDRLKKCLALGDYIDETGMDKALYKISLYAYQASKRLKDAREYHYSEEDEAVQNAAYWKGKYYESLYYEQVNGYMDLISLLWLLGMIKESARQDAILIADEVAKRSI